MTTFQILTFLALITATIYGSAQTQLPVTDYPVDRSIEADLKRHNIPLTPTGLIEALRNPDPDVRQLAVARLEEDEAVLAVPQIRNAFAAEKEFQAKLNFALALGHLGDSGPIDWLKETCQASNVPAYYRIQAATYLSSLKRGSFCLDVVLDALKPGKHNKKARMAAISFLSVHPNLPDKNLQAILGYLLPDLRSQNPAERWAAAATLAGLGLDEAIPFLEQEIARDEPADENARALDLFSLEEPLQQLKNQVVVTGHVVDSHQQPVPGARITLGMENPPVCHNSHDPVTDDEGHYRFVCVLAGTIEIPFGAIKNSPGYHYYDLFTPPIDPRQPQILLTPGSRLDLDIPLGPPNGVLEGNIFDALNGSIVSDAQITISRKQPQSEYSAKIPQNGHFKFALPPVAIEISITAPGYRSWKFQDELSGTTHLTLKSAEHRVIKIELTPEK